MAQHDYNIANQTTAAFRTDLNNALSAIVSNNSGTSAPSTTFANQWWYDTTNDILKIRNEADTAWINVGYINQISGEFEPYIAGTQITDFLDEDAMTSNSATAVASQQSIKAYVDDNTITQTSGTAPYYAARAFVYVDDGSNAANTYYGQNIASVVRNSTGKYTITFTTAMPDANYAIAMGPNSQGSANTSYGMTIGFTAKSAGSFTVQARRTTNFDAFDCDQMSFTIFA